MSNEEDDYVVIPFVITDRHGGEYDTEAFNAGWHLSLLETRLTLAEAGDLIVPPVILKTKWRAQVDLIAMSHNLMVRVRVSDEEPDYAFYHFGTQEFFDSFDAK